MNKTKKTDNLINSVVKESKLPIEENIINFFSSGITLFDLASGGGIPTSKVINIVGDKSTGKTLLALEILAYIKHLLKEKLVIYYDDCESGFSFNEKDIYNVQIFDESIKPSETVEDLQLNFEIQLNKIKEKHNLIYIVDSLDGLSSEAELQRIEKENEAKRKGKKIETGSYKIEKAKKMSELFRVFNNKIKQTNSILIIISQVHDNIGVMFGKKDKRSGGRALDFYAAQVIWLSECEKIRKKDRITGIRIKLKFEKNKVGKPFRECFLDILFDYGVDNITSNINYLYDLLDKTGKNRSKLDCKIKKIKWNETEKEEMTVKSLVKYIEDNNLEKELEKRVIEKWNKIETDISSKDRKNKY